MDDTKDDVRRTRVLLADEEELVRIGLRTLLNRCADFEVVGEAAAGPDAFRKTVTHQPDVVITDTRLRNSCGIALCREIKAAAPRTKVMMFTGQHTEEVLRASMAAGASGYALKRWQCDDVVARLREVSRAHERPDATAVHRVIAHTRTMTRNPVTSAFTPLSAQELHILTLLSEGKTNRSIATALALSTGTVRNYVSSVLSKLNVRNRAEAAAYAASHRIHEYI